MLRGVIWTVFDFAFSAWMLYDCWRHDREAYWYWVILATGGLGTIVYFFTHYLPGSRIEFNLWRRLSVARQIRDLRRRAGQLGTGVAYEMLGDACLRAHRHREAEAAYRQALALQPDLFEARVRLGYVLVDLDRVDEAWPLLGQAYQARPDYDNYHLVWKLARCQFRRGKLEDARNLYAFFLRQHSYSEARLEYAHVLFRRGEREAAEATLQELLRDIEFSPPYARSRERPWSRAAKRLLRSTHQAESPP